MGAAGEGREEDRVRQREVEREAGEGHEAGRGAVEEPPAVRLLSSRPAMLWFRTSRPRFVPRRSWRRRMAGQEKKPEGGEKEQHQEKHEEAVRAAEEAARQAHAQAHSEAQAAAGAAAFLTGSADYLQNVGSR